MNLREQLMQVEARMTEIREEISKDEVTAEILAERQKEIEELKESRDELRSKIEILDETDFQPYENKGSRGAIGLTPKNNSELKVKNCS